MQLSRCLCLSAHRSGRIGLNRMAHIDDKSSGGSLLFEPKGYDYVNDASHEYKEAIKVGYNIRRKVVLMAIWAFAPIVLWFEPSLLA